MPSRLPFRYRGRLEITLHLLFVGLVLPFVVAVGSVIAVGVVRARWIAQVPPLSFWTGYWVSAVVLLTIGVTVIAYLKARDGFGW